MKEYIKKFKKEPSLVLRFRVRAQAAKTGFVGELEDGTIKLDLKAIPEKGQANKELVRYLTKKFGVELEDVKIISGKNSRNKLVKIVKKHAKKRNKNKGA